VASGESSPRQERIVIAIRIGNGAVSVTTKPYSERAVEVIRAIPGRRWDASRKRWVLPVNTVTRSVELLVASGERVEVNGKPWAGTLATQRQMAAQRAAEVQVESQANPFMALWKVLPAVLRQRTYDALWQVLAPGGGGGRRSGGHVGSSPRCLRGASTPRSGSCLMRGDAHTKLTLADLLYGEGDPFILDCDDDLDPEEVGEYWYCRVMSPDECAGLTWR
jgi:hypothetical protein